MCTKEKTPCRHCPVGSINHSLYHCTTRIPVVVDPALWWSRHLEILRVASRPASPPATPTLPLYSSRDGSPPFEFVLNYLSTVKYTDPSFAHSLSLIRGAFKYLPGGDFAFVFPNRLIPLREGLLNLHLSSMSTTLTSHCIITYTQLPFAALTTPTLRTDARAKHHNHHRCPPAANACIQPSDIALLIALAQCQRTVLPSLESYTVHVLAPDKAAEYVCGITAEVKRAYLLALEEPWRRMEALEVQQWQVPIRYEADIVALRLGKLRAGNDNYLNLRVTGVIRGLVCALGESAKSLLNQDSMGNMGNLLDKCKAMKLPSRGKCKRKRVSEPDDRSKRVRTTR